MAKTFDGPPTLERSGYEHRRAVTSFLLRRKAWLEVELPLAKGRRRDSKNTFFNGKEGRDDFRKTPSLTVRKDGLILENSVSSCPISRCNPREGVETQQ